MSLACHPEPRRRRATSRFPTWRFRVPGGIAKAASGNVNQRVRSAIFLIRSVAALVRSITVTGRSTTFLGRSVAVTGRTPAVRGRSVAMRGCFATVRIRALTMHGCLATMRIRAVTVRIRLVTMHGCSVTLRIRFLTVLIRSVAMHGGIVTGTTSDRRFTESAEQRCQGDVSPLPAEKIYSAWRKVFRDFQPAWPQPCSKK